MHSHDNIELQVAELITKMPLRTAGLRKLIAANISTHQIRIRMIRIIKADPALCANVLRLANTDSPEQTGQIETVEEALNIAEPKSLVKKLIAISGLNGQIPAEIFSSKPIRKYFHHSRRIARASGILARIAGFDETAKQKLETAGLIHDIGRLVILMTSYM